MNASAIPVPSKTLITAFSMSEQMNICLRAMKVRPLAIATFARRNDLSSNAATDTSDTPI